MKLGSQTGSLINHVLADTGLPKVGEGATLLAWSDRYPGTVISVDEKKQIVGVQSDLYDRIDNNGLSESQTYVYTRDPKGNIEYFRMNKKTGRWDQVRQNPASGRWVKVNWCGVAFGHRERFYDFTF